MSIEAVYVDKRPGAFQSMAVAARDFGANELVAKIQGWTAVPKSAYSTVQVGPDSHIELNSDLVYCNHSCDPNIVFDVTRMEVRTIRAVTAGQPLTFFYPSSEWDMAQPFACTCGSVRCLKEIRGAKYLDRSILKLYWLNKHIEALLD